MSRIYADPGDLDRAAKRVKAAALHTKSAGAGISHTSFPDMPGHVRARVAEELSDALDDLRVLVADSATLAMMLARTAMKFRKTDGDEDGKVDLGAALAELDRRKLLVGYIGSGQRVPGEAPDKPFDDWDQFISDLAIGAGSAAWLANPAHWEVVKVRKGTKHRGQVVRVKKTGRTTRYLYYGRYARNQIMTNVLRRQVPASKLNYKLREVPGRAKVPHGVGLSKALGAIGAAAGMGMEYANAHQRHSYNLTLDDGGVRTRAGVESAVKTAGAVGGGVALGGLCGAAAAPTVVGAAPAAAVCGAVGSWAGGKVAGAVISIFK